MFPAVTSDTFLDPRTGRTREKRFITLRKAEKDWIDKSRRNPAAFIEYLTEKTPAAHHKIWLANLFHPTRRRLNFVAPRESAKTTIMTYALAWVIGSNPLLTHMIVSESSTIAKDRLRAVRDVIANDVRFRNVFPHIFIDSKRPDTSLEFSVWSTEGGLQYSGWRSLVTRNGDPKGHTLRAAGVGSAIIGNRVSGMMLLDDLISFTSATPKAQDDIASYVMQTLIPFLQENAKAVNIGTRWLANDWPERLINNPEWYSVVIPAIIKREGKPDMSYWPEYWPLEKLERRRAEMRDDVAFRIQYMNDPSAITASLFKNYQLNNPLPNPLPPLKEVYITTDTAFSTSTQADWTVFYLVGFDADDNLYILDMVRFKAEVVDQVPVLASLCQRALMKPYDKLNGVLIENVGFQATLGSLISRASTDVHIPVVPVRPVGDKMHRATIVSDYVKMGKIFFNMDMADYGELVREWTNFPKYAHDDTLDPIGLLLQWRGGSAIEARVSRVSMPKINKTIIPGVPF